MTTIRTLAACGMLGAVAGCAPLDRLPMSDFRPTGPDTFEFRARQAKEGGFYDERDVMGWLETWLADNGMCPKGYEITGKEAVAENQYVDRVYYQGRCT